MKKKAVRKKNTEVVILIKTCQWKKDTNSRQNYMKINGFKKKMYIIDTLCLSLTNTKIYMIYSYNINLMYIQYQNTHIQNALS